MTDDYLQIQAGRKERQRKQLASIGRWTLRIGAGAIAAFFGGMMIAGLTRETADDRLQAAKEIGFAEAQKRLETILIAPTTATYQEDAVTVTEGHKFQNRSVWHVFGTLDSQNRMGVPLRGKWSTMLVRDGKEFVPFAVRYNDEEIWMKPDWLTFFYDEETLKNRAD